MNAIRVVFLLFAAIILSVECNGLCQDYLRCMEQLEVKQHECLALERNLRSRSNTVCSRSKWDKKLELNALHMRRAEMARDCVRRSMTDADISESTLDPDTREHCDALHDRFQYARNETTPIRKKRSPKRSKRDAKEFPAKALECRNAARIWHRQCSALARCCPLTADCKQDTKEVMEQIYEGRDHLRRLNEDCAK
ncbi:unnamed protein product [Caenorhabditis auriculariae]|uniref:Uncharacterized protein n=1 Tax=Caenorhabditis auriculariae TaxID=2777116 RepID=A0A8S1HEW6_9PELO|nr:unnamed protein product [Caenorhabditis auriculariae]